jgi:hypothetical protein
MEPARVHKYARLAQGAYDYAYKSKAAAMRGLKKSAKFVPELADFEIVPEFSNNDFVAYRNNITGERHLAGRGSDADFYKADKNIDSLMRGKGARLKNVGDWITNLKFAAGKATTTERYQNAEHLLKSFASAEGVPIKDVTLSGHSLSGGYMKYLSRKFGNIAHVYNAATHPFKKLRAKVNIHPSSKIYSDRTYADAVSLGEMNPEEGNIELTNHTATVGTETDALAHHDLKSQFLQEPVRVNENGDLVQIKTTKLRNATGLTAGSALEFGAKTAIMAIPAFALAPTYDTALETKYRRAEMGTELLKGAIEFEGGLLFASAVGEGGLPLDVPFAALNFIVSDLTTGADANDPHSVASKFHKATKAIREPIFGKDPEVKDEYTNQPAPIEWFNKHFSHERYEEEQIKKQIQAYADENDIGFSEAAEIYYGHYEAGGSFDPDDLASKTEEELQEMGLVIDRPTETPSDLKQLLQRNPYLHNEPGLDPTGGVHAKWRRDKEAWDKKTEAEYWKKKEATQKRHQLEYERAVQRKKIEEKIEADIKYKQSSQYNIDQKEIEMRRSQQAQPPTHMRRRIGGEI